VIAYLQEACAAGARLGPACELLGLSPRTLQRWREEAQVKADGRQAAAQRREPANKLCAQERQQILAIANQPEFAHLPPSQIVPALARLPQLNPDFASFMAVGGF
jgi:transposase-like protein